jgi:hypothetical protein
MKTAVEIIVYLIAGLAISRFLGKIIIQKFKQQEQ